MILLLIHLVKNDILHHQHLILKVMKLKTKSKKKKGKQWRKQLGAYRLVKPLSYIIVKNI